MKALPGTGKRATGKKLEKTFFGAYMGPEKGLFPARVENLYFMGIGPSTQKDLSSAEGQN